MLVKKLFTSFTCCLFIFVSLSIKAKDLVEIEDTIPPLKVYFFLAPSCPISQQYTIEIKRLDSLYRNHNVEMILVFPTNQKTSIKQEVKQFIAKYGLTLPLLSDKNFKLTKELNATVTPEVFLVKQNNLILYHGAIDNWYYALGKNRIEITAHYLEDAILATRNNMPIYSPYVAPVGCFIETK